MNKSCEREFMVKAGIVGGTGYTGVGLIRILAQHPNVEITAITSRGEAGALVPEMFPSSRHGLSFRFENPAIVDFAKCDEVFLSIALWSKARPDRMCKI
jgi:N-acetyl-gamma-glutamyl-phosphate reductase